MGTNMNFQEFLNDIKDIEHNCFKFYKRNVAGRYTVRDNEHIENCIGYDWCTGGVTGGSCWGGVPDQAQESEKEPDFDTLDEIFEKVCPTLTFSQYKKLIKILPIKEYDYEVNEYYGNFRSHSAKYIMLEDLFNTLKNEGYIQ